MIDSANKNMLYSTRKWFLCLVNTLFKFVIRANSLALPVLGGRCRHFSFYTGWKHPTIARMIAVQGLPWTSGMACDYSRFLFCFRANRLWTPSAAARGYVCLTMAWPRRNGGQRNAGNPGKAKPRSGILAKNIFSSKYWHSNYIMLYCVSILKDESSL